MGFSVDIDTGGTFTDGLFSDGTRLARAKVDTTPHDLTISLFSCIYAGATAFGLPSVKEFLRQCDTAGRFQSGPPARRPSEKMAPDLRLGCETRLVG